MRRHLRAALIAFHVVALVLVNIPAPTGSPLALTGHDPSAAEELEPWARLLKMSREQLAARLLEIRARWLSIRARVLAPFDAYHRWAGAQQPWQMFSAPNRVPARIVLETASARDPEWRFAGGLPRGPFRPALFDSERMRSLVNSLSREAAHAELDTLCDALGRALLHDRPDADQARCRILLRRSPAIGQADADVAATLVHERRVSRP